MRYLIPRKLPCGRNNPAYQVYRRKRRRHWLEKYKEAKGCSVCGYNASGVALDFDHLDRDGKSFTVSSGQLTRSLQSIFTELRKCRVVCANCHRVHTYQNLQFYNRVRCD